MSKSTTLRDGLKVPVLSGEAAAKLIEDGAVSVTAGANTDVAYTCPGPVIPLPISPD